WSSDVCSSDLHEIRARHLEVTEFHRLQVRQVLVGDRAHGQRGEVDLVGAAEMKQQVERAFEGADAKPELGVSHRLASLLTASPRLRLRLLMRAAARTAIMESDAPPP